MTAATLAPVAELRRLRTALADARRELAQLRTVIAAPDPMTTVGYWAGVFRIARQAAAEAAYRRGREDEGAEMAAAWHAVADPAAAGGPSFAELELRRWGPGGRAHFGDPRPGDYRGGPVEWDGSREAGAA